MNAIAERRNKAVEACLGDVKQIARSEGVTRDTIGKLAGRLKELAADTALWDESSFAPPDEGDRQARYLIAEDADKTFALYLNVMRPSKRIPPHNHTTWACIAAVEGTELNYLYDRLDDRSVEGKARIRQREQVELKPGTALGMLGDDIHSVEIPEGGIIRHLHMYGNSLETLSERMMFDEEAGTCRVMDIGVKTRT